MSGQKKPTGTSGTMKPGAEGPPYKFERQVWPTSKADVEQLIVSSVVSSKAFSAGLLPWLGRPTRNEEDHFDFSFPDEPGTYLELMEVAPIERPGGYAQVSLHNVVGALIEAVWIRLTQKAQGYGRIGSWKVHLLLYSTDLAFELFPPASLLLSHNFRIANRGFMSAVYLAKPGNEPEVLFPRPESDFYGFSARHAGRQQFRVGDLPAARVEGNSIMVSFPPTRSKP